MKSFEMSDSIKSSILFSVFNVCRNDQQNTIEKILAVFFAHFTGNNSFTIRNMCMTKTKKKKKKKIKKQ